MSSRRSSPTRSATTSNFAENTIGANASEIDFKTVSGLAISACGTAYLAGLIGKYWFERYARLPVEIDVASEFRYREMPLQPSQAALFISQSGETADTLASLRYCKDNGLKIGAVVNVQEFDDRARIRCRLPDHGWS